MQVEIEKFLLLNSTIIFTFPFSAIYETKNLSRKETKQEIHRELMDSSAEDLETYM